MKWWVWAPYNYIPGEMWRVAESLAGDWADSVSQEHHGPYETQQEAQAVAELLNRSGVKGHNQE